MTCPRSLGLPINPRHFMIQFKNIEVIIISYSSCCFPPQPSGNWAKYVLVFHRSLVVHASAIMAKNVLFLFFNCRAVERPRCGLHLLHREAFPAHAQGAHPAPHHPQPHRRSRIPRHESLGEGKLVRERGGREGAQYIFKEVMDGGDSSLPIF